MKETFLNSSVSNLSALELPALTRFSESRLRNVSTGLNSLTSSLSSEPETIISVKESTTLGISITIKVKSSTSNVCLLLIKYAVKRSIIVFRPRRREIASSYLKVFVVFSSTSALSSTVRASIFFLISLFVL